MQEFLFPALTGLTLVFAGILVGYFLWFRDRSDQLILAEQLATDNERLNAELSSHTAMITELEDRTSRLDLKNTSLQQLCDDLLHSREKVQLRANDLESELHSARKKIESENPNQKAEITRLAAENKQLALQLHESKARIAKIDSELQAHHEILETAKTNAAGMEKEYVSLESSLRSKIELVNEARGKAAAALSAQNLAEDALKTARQQLEELKARLAKLESEAGDVEILRGRCEHLEMSLTLKSERVESLILQRDDSLMKQKSLIEEISGLKVRLENQMGSLEQMRSQTQATEQRRQKNQHGLVNQLEQLQESNQTLQSEKDRLLEQLTEAQNWRQKNDNTLKQVSEDNAMLLASLAEYEKLDPQSLISSEEYKSRIDSVVKQRDSACEEVDNLKSVIKRMKQHAKSNEETIRNLRRERGVILMRNREHAAQYPRIHGESLDFSRGDELSSEYGGTTKLEPVRGHVFVEPPRRRDNLKLIHGVGEVLEKKLNSFGIYTFKQIMEWDEAAVKEFSELLVFKDRIQRDDWQGQAEQMYHRKPENDAA